MFVSFDLWAENWSKLNENEDSDLQHDRSWHLNVPRNASLTRSDLTKTEPTWKAARAMVNSMLTPQTLSKSYHLTRNSPPLLWLACCWPCVWLQFLSVCVVLPQSRAVVAWACGGWNWWFGVGNGGAVPRWWAWPRLEKDRKRVFNKFVVLAWSIAQPTPKNGWGASWWILTDTVENSVQNNRAADTIVLLLRHCKTPAKPKFLNLKKSVKPPP